MTSRKNAVTLVAVLFLVLLTAAGWYAYEHRSSSSGSEPQNPIPDSYSLEDISVASTTAQCYAAIGDSVYDFTLYVQGNPAVATICGTDATQAAGGLGNQPEETFADLRIGSFRR